MQTRNTLDATLSIALVWPLAALAEALQFVDRILAGKMWEHIDDHERMSPQGTK